MEARAVVKGFQFCTWIDSEKVKRRPPSGSARFSRRLKEEQSKRHVLVAAAHLPKSNRHRHVAVDYNHWNPASPVESGNFHAHFDESYVLKTKSQEIEPYLKGRCIYLVGMMGSGKTTVGKILAQALNYSFIDSDAFVEHEAGGKTVAEIFKLYGEGFFRDKETEALRKLSMMQRYVVSTGGGAVVRPVNWKCMQKGISVWLDVPLEALAQRIADVGTGSRPLLHQGPGDAYSKTFMRLSSLFEERGNAYANANARVSLENIAAKMGYRDVSNLSPTAIALEALQQIECFLEEERGRARVF
ncbi:shikimate kinase 1, chloroplastic-like [Rosa rugosa]|uniref:shikimate kinase 1, chloroplastic-like n=1 Tax=Rosa rugosa TaxID=74645 RepID=UPI002B416767|nr:shikimate kinase 1, chloroplastic-like [Rosa rugosa]